jgi:hypothetical protein
MMAGSVHAQTRPRKRDDSQRLVSRRQDACQWALWRLRRPAREPGTREKTRARPCRQPEAESSPQITLKGPARRLAARMVHGLAWRAGLHGTGNQRVQRERPSSLMLRPTAAPAREGHEAACGGPRSHCGPSLQPPDSAWGPPAWGPQRPKRSLHAPPNECTSWEVASQRPGSPPALPGGPDRPQIARNPEISDFHWSPPSKLSRNSSRASRGLHPGAHDQPKRDQALLNDHQRMGPTTSKTGLARMRMGRAKQQQQRGGSKR